MKVFLNIILLTSFLTYFLPDVSAMETGSTSGSVLEYSYMQISQDEGLTSTINCIYKEKDKFIWVGTQNGIFKLDGQGVKHYGNESKSIYNITSDRHGRIWVLSQDGASIYDEKQDSFNPIPPPPTENKNTSLPIFSFIQTERYMYLGSKNRVFIYDYSEGSGLKEFKVFNTGRRFFVQNMLMLPGGDIMCCDSREGIMILGADGTIKDNPFDCPKEVTCAFLDSSERLWIACYNRGLYSYDRYGNLLAHYGSSDSDLSGDVILTIIEKDSMIWAGTDGMGINIIDPDNGKIEVLSQVPGNRASLPASSIKCLYKDSFGNVWAGSIRDGLISIRQRHINTYSVAYIGETSGLSNPTVLFIYQESGSNSIWIGTDGEGIDRFDPKTKRFTHYPATLHTKVVSIGSWSDSHLVLSLYSKGLFLFSKDTGKLTPLEIKNDMLSYQIKYTNLAINLCNEADGELLLLSTRAARWNKATGILEYIDIEGEEKVNGFLLPIRHDSSSVFLYDNTGIYQLRTGESSMRKIFKMSGGNRINSVFMAGDGTFWLGTEMGLAKFNAESNSFSYIRSSLFKKAVSVVCDTRNRVWVATVDRLVTYIIDENRFAMFSSSDGVKPNEFLNNARLLSNDGEVYFGGVKGLLHIGKIFSLDTDESPIVSISDISIDGTQVFPGKDKAVKVRHGNKAVAFHLMAEEKDIFREKIYRYSLSGKDGRWFESSSPEIILRPLPPPGKHELYVSCSTRAGKWTAPAHLVTLDVRPAWYNTWWFYSICILVFGSATIMIFRMELRRKDEKLSLEVKETERKVYEDKVRFLINISHEMRTPLTLIIAPLKRMLGKIPPSDPNFQSLSMIYRQSTRMKELLNTILDLRKMEVQENTLKMESVDLNSWISEISGDYIIEGRGQGVEIKTELDPSVGQVSLDKKKCEIVLTNLLINALRYSPKNSTVTIRTKSAGEEMVRVEIEDQGAGLQGADPEKLFVRFYQRDNEHSGSGIGLSYAKILVELHKGIIGAYDNPDKGATFFFELPSNTGEKTVIIKPSPYLNTLISADDYTPGVAGESNKTDKGAAAEKSGDRPKLLFADDNRDLVSFILESLEASYNIRIAFNGAEAEKLIKEEMPDIIVSDINMPETDGYELCRFVKSEPCYSHIPVILLTAQNEERIQREGYETGADAFMGKPFEIETLDALIRNLLMQKEKIRQRYLQPAGTEKPSVKAVFSAADEGLLIKINKVIGENLSNPELGIPLICKEVGISRALLYNKLKAITGMGANDYINKIRMENAISLVESTVLSFAEIAEKTGFSTPSYFSTAFRQHAGMTPSQYRAMKSKDKKQVPE